MQTRLVAITQPYVQRDDGIHDHDNYVGKLEPEEYIIWCARASSEENRLNHETAPKLLRYLVDHKHWSSFEMISIGFEIVTSRAIAHQLLRHRSFSFQEFSQRYAEVENLEDVELRDKAFKAYQLLLEQGVAKETARMVLPLCTQTALVMHGTLRSWIHFLEQQCDDHAQKEVREIALQIRESLSSFCPRTATALGWE